MIGTHLDRVGLANGSRYASHWRYRQQHADGSWTDFRSLGGIDWCEGAEWGKDVDDAGSNVSISLRREVGDDSLAPLVTDSVFNQVVGGYAPRVYFSRRFEVQVAITAAGNTPSANDWFTLVAGATEEVEVGGKGSVVFISGRDDLKLMDRVILTDEEEEFGSESGTPLETVVQQVLNHYLTTAAPVIEFPTPLNFSVTSYKTRPGQTIREAVDALLGHVGGYVEQRWHTGALRLVAMLPNRNSSSASPVAVLGPDQYLDIKKSNQKESGIRNTVKVRFWNKSTKKIDSVTAVDSDSIAALGGFPLGVRAIEFTEGDGSAIDTVEEAWDFANLILEDLSTPLVQQEIENLFWPWVELGDYIQWEPNFRITDNAYIWAVTGFRHRLGKTHRTTFRTSGQAKGGSKRWRRGTGVITLPPTDNDPFGYSQIRSNTSGEVSGLFAGDGPAVSFGYRLSKLAPIDEEIDEPTGLTIIDKRSGTFVVDPAVFSIEGNEVAYLSGWFFTGPNGTGEHGQRIISEAVIPEAGGPDGQVSAAVDAGKVKASITGNLLVQSFGWLATKGAPAPDSAWNTASVISARAAELVDVLDLAVNETGYVTVWFFDGPGGTGARSAPKSALAVRPDDVAVVDPTHPLSDGRWLATLDDVITLAAREVAIAQSFVYGFSEQSGEGGLTIDRILSMPIYDPTGTIEFFNTAAGTLNHLAFGTDVVDGYDRMLHFMFSKSEDNANHIYYGNNQTLQQLQPAQAGADITAGKPLDSLSNLFAQFIAYSGSVSIESLKPAQAGADITAGKPLSTLSSLLAGHLAYSNGWNVDTARPAEMGAETTTGKPLSILSDRLAGHLAYNNGWNVDTYRPAEAGAQVTTGKPLSSLSSLLAGHLAYGNGWNVDTYRPGEAGANVTEGRTSNNVLTGGGRAVEEGGANRTQNHTSNDVLFGIGRAVLQAGADVTGSNTSNNVLTGGGRAVEESGANRTQTNVAADTTNVGGTAAGTVATGTARSMAAITAANMVAPMRVDEAAFVNLLFADAAIVDRVFAQNVFSNAIFTKLLASDVVLFTTAVGTNIIAKNIHTHNLSAYSAVLGTVVAGRILNAQPENATRGIQISADAQWALPPGVIAGMNLSATEGAPFLFNPAFNLRANGFIEIGEGGAGKGLSYNPATGIFKVKGRIEADEGYFAGTVTASQFTAAIVELVNSGSVRLRVGGPHGVGGVSWFNADGTVNLSTIFAESTDLRFVHGQAFSFRGSGSGASLFSLDVATPRVVRETPAIIWVEGRGARRLWVDNNNFVKVDP